MTSKEQPNEPLSDALEKAHTLETFAQTELEEENEESEQMEELEAMMTVHFSQEIHD